MARPARVDDEPGIRKCTHHASYTTSMVKMYVCWNYIIELGYQAFVENEYDLCIFDVMMPNKDGFTLASDIRKKDTKVPIIFLTVKALK